MRGRVVVVGVLLGALVACSGSSEGAGPTTGAPASTTTTAAPAAERTRSAAPVGVERSSCDPIGAPRGLPAGEQPRCGLPFPNDWFTVVDPSTDTGIRVDLRTGDMPENKDGTPIDVTEQDRNDGFSPGAALLVDVPDLDLDRTGAAPITDIGASLDDDAPIVVVDTTTGERHPYFAELDANAGDLRPLLLVHPATNWVEGHRYAVGLRDLKRGDGGSIDVSAAFDSLRDDPTASTELVESRRAGIEQVIGDLGRAGVDRKDLVLAWDFTVASERSLSERVLHMRDDAFESLGDGAPEFTVTKVTDATEGAGLRTVVGTFEVPKYLTGTGEGGSVMNNGDDHTDSPLPDQDGTWTANFDCTIPKSAVRADGSANPTRMSLYGHGLLGDASQVEGVGPEYARVSNTTFCATDWIGLSASDVPNAIAALQDLSKFRSMADRMQQGMLDFPFLGRLMKSPKGLTTDKAFQAADGSPLLDHEHLVLVGLSQGGIMGGGTTAIAQDWDRALLGVPGANYSLLLNRSVDFDEYGAILEPAYPDPADRQLALQLIQMLWDRGENDGYAQHIGRDPYPGTKAKQVLLLEAFGDHQVANISTEVLARTIGAQLRSPAIADGRDTAKEPFWGLEATPSLPARGGSYLVLWDFGTPAPPITNTPNRGGEDPHGKGRDEERVLQMGATFLEDGSLVDVCDGAPCTSPP